MNENTTNGARDRTESRHDTTGHDSAMPGRDTVNMAKDSHRYTDTPTDALTAFKGAGLEVIRRTIQRYCDRGVLDAIRINPLSGEPTENLSYFEWAIDPNSYAAQWTRMREHRERHPRQQNSSVAPGRVSGRQSAPGHDMTRQEVPKQEEIVSEPLNPTATTSDSAGTVAALEKEVGELKEELLKTRIEKQAAHEARAAMQEVVSMQMDKLEKGNIKLGEARAQLLALGSPVVHTDNDKEGGLSNAA